MTLRAPASRASAAGPRDVVHGAHGVGGVADGDDLGLARHDELLEGVPVEGAGLEVDGDLADDCAALGQPHPRAAVGLVVELRDHHLVAGADVARDRVAEQEGERRHVGAVGDLVPGAAKEVGAGLLRALDDGVRLLRGGEGAVDVAVVVGEVVEHRVQHPLRRLRAAGSVEVRGGLTVDRPPERGELAADVGDVERGHGLTSGRWWQEDKCTVPVQEWRARGRMVGRCRRAATRPPSD